MECKEEWVVGGSWFVYVSCLGVFRSVALDEIEYCNDWGLTTSYIYIYIGTYCE